MTSTPNIIMKKIRPLNNIASITAAIHNPIIVEGLIFSKVSLTENEEIKFFTVSCISFSSLPAGIASPEYDVKMKLNRAIKTKTIQLNAHQLNTF